jgi:hypothetical protein
MVFCPRRRDNLKENPMINETHMFIGLCIMLGFDILIIIALWDYDEEVVRPELPEPEEIEEE